MTGSVSNPADLRARGRIDIIDLKGLQSASCECYGTVKAHYDSLLNH